MAEKIIVDIEMSSEDVRKAEREIMAARKRVDELREANKQLDKSSEAYTKNALELKRLNGEIRTNERVLIANTKAQKANDGSINQLRSQLSQVTVQWAKLSKEERENTDEGRRLVAQKKQLTDQLKNLEKQTGDTRRNVGNYSEGMREALVSSTGFGKGLKGVFGIISANPIMGLVQIIATLVLAVGKAQFIVDAFSKVMEPFNAIFERAIGILQEFTQGVMAKIRKAFDDPKQAIKDLGKAIIDNIINRFKAVGKIFQAIADRDFKALSNAALQLGTGVEGLVDKAGKLGEEFNKAAQTGRRIAELTKEIEEAEIDLISTQAKLNKQIEEQRFAVEDLSLSEKQRTEAAKGAISDIQKLADEQKKVLDKQIEQAELRASLNDTDRAAQKELAQLIAQRDELEAQRISRQKEVRNQLNTINKQIADEERRNQEERKKAAEEAQKARLEQAKQDFESQVKALEMETQQGIAEQKKLLIEGQISREQYNQTISDLEEAAILAQQELYKDDAEKQMDLEQQLLDFRIKKMDEEAKAQEDLTKKIEDENKKRIESEKQRFENEQRASEMRRDLAVQSLAFVSQAFGKETLAYKLLASAQAAITTYSNASKAYASQLSVPTPDAPIRAKIAAALAIAQGLAQVAKINATNVPKFADGVIGLQGPGTETSDSISAHLSKGESVITAKATKVYAPVLAQMEQSVGNRPNFQLGHRRFARGIIAAGNLPAISAGRSAATELRDLERVMQQMKVFVSLTELNEAQREFATAQSFARITE